jgi:hypothetical protein
MCLENPIKVMYVAVHYPVKKVVFITECQENDFGPNHNPLKLQLLETFLKILFESKKEYAHSIGG